MIKQVVFIITLIFTIAAFSYTISGFYSFFRLCKSPYPLRNFFKRIGMTLKVAFLQNKIFRRPVIGFVHALVFWGFLVICIGSLEMVLDGITGYDKSFACLGTVYDVITAACDIYAYLVALCIIIFLFRRIILKIKRFEGIEMKRKFYVDANIALSLILFLMISLIFMDIVLCLERTAVGLYPVSNLLVPGNTLVSHYSLNIFYELFWWTHILLIFFFANYLPYSKHFHVFMSIPNVFISRLEPLGKLPNMENVTKEVR